MGEQIISASGTQFGLIVNADGSINTSATAGGLIGNINYDEINLNYSGLSDPSQVIYKNLGSVVVTLNLTYSGTSLTSVVKA